MQFYFIEKNTKNFLWDWYELVLKIPLALTDVGMGQFTQQWVMTTWNKQTTNILARKPVAVKSSEKRQTAS